MVKRNNRHGFTIAELLIVVAIIAVLVAIAIPVFGNILENSREATDAANIRSSYAEAVAKLLAMTAKQQADTKDGTGITADTKYTIQQQTGGWTTSPDWSGPLSKYMDGETAENKKGAVKAGTGVIQVAVRMGNDGQVEVVGISKTN